MNFLKLQWTEPLNISYEGAFFSTQKEPLADVLQNNCVGVSFQ